MNITRARRQVEHQHIQIGPSDIFQHLHQRALRHRAAPYHRLFAIDQIADGHGVYAVRLNGNEVFILAQLRFVGNAQKMRHARPVNIGIKQAGGIAHFCQCGGEIDGDGGFADPAFAGSDSNHCFNAFENSGNFRARAVMRGFFLRRAMRCQNAGHGDNAAEIFYRLLSLRLQPVQCFRRQAINLNRKADIAVAQHQTLHAVGGNQRLRIAAGGNRIQSRENIFLDQSAHG